MRIVKLALISIMLLQTAHGLRDSINATLPESHRSLAVNKKLRRAPKNEEGEGPRFKKCEIVVKGSPLDFPAGIRVKKYLKKANITVIKVKCGRESAVVEKLRTKGIIAEENFEMYALATPNDAYFSPYQWHMDTVQAKQAWDITTGEGVVVAVLDTGLSQNQDGISCVVSPYNTVDENNDVTDVDGHGTHVAGTIGQKTNNNVGTVGLAHGACIMPVKVLGDDGSGSLADIAEGVAYAVANGAHVINMSLGAPAPGMTSDNGGVMDTALQNAYAAGVVVVAASGNDASTTQVSYPSIHPTVISVGSVGYDEIRAGYSNYGPNLDIMAPGGDLGEDLNSDGYADGVLQETIQDGSWSYYFLQGTSMAAPHVAAAAALLISAGVASSPADVKSILRNTAKNVGSTEEYGAGLIQVYNALTSGSSGGTGPMPTDPSVGATPVPTPQPTPAPTLKPTPFPSPKPTTSSTGSCLGYGERCDLGGGSCCNDYRCKGRRKKRCR